jgi:type 1 glutamine amidotransferase
MRSLIPLFAVPLFAGTPVRILILTGQSDIQYHDWRVSTPFIEQALSAAGRFDVRVEAEPRGITRETLDGYDAIIVNYNGPRWGAGAESAVADFVRSGKGLVTFHGVTYGPLMGTLQQPGNRWSRGEPWDAWISLLGATWAAENIGHAPRHAFTVKLSDHPITRGMATSFTVNDELYHRMDLRTGVRVIASARDEAAPGGTGRDEPVAWTNSYGSGRVFHCTLGHDTSALYEPSVLALLARGAEWAATREVTGTPEVRLREAPSHAPRVLVATGGHDYPPSFYSIFESYRDIRWSHISMQKPSFPADLQDRFDVLVLYDMNNQIDEAAQKSLRGFVEAGKGVVAMHHAIVDYTSWPWWWEEVTGGKYFEKAEGGHQASHFQEDVPMVMRVAKGQERHPILRGVGDLVTVDECYRGMWHSPKITVLLETENELNDRPVVYLGPNPAYRAVYIQLGHGEYTHRHPGYRTLVHNAIFWAAGRQTAQ